MNNSSPNINTSPMQDPPKKLKSSFESIPVKSSFDSLGKAYSNNLYYNTGYGNSKYDEGFNFDAQFDENDPLGSINEHRAQNQGWGTKAGAGLGRIAVKVGSEIAKIPGYIGGLAGGLYGEASDAITGKNEYSFTDQAFNNAWVKSISEINENINEELLPVYVKKAVKEGNLWDNITSVDFWATEGADGIGFMASMMIPGAVLKSLNLGAKMARGSELLAATVSKGTQFEKLMKGAQKVPSIFKAKNFDVFNATVVNTYLESAAEAGMAMDSFEKQNKNEFIDQQLALGKTLEEANQLFNTQKAILGKNIFVSNVALLTLPNGLQSAMMFGKGASKFMSSYTTKEAVKAAGKRIVGSTLSEGFLEEASQTTVENYFKNKALKNNLKGDGLFSFDDFDPNGLKEAYLDTISSVEGQKAIFLGGVLGSSMSVIQGRKEDIHNKKESDKATSLTERYDNTLNALVNTKGNVSYDYNNNPIVSKKEIIQKFKTIDELTHRFKEYDEALESGNEEVLEKARNKTIQDVILPFAKQGELGLEALNNYYDKMLESDEVKNSEEFDIIKARKEEVINTAKEASKKYEFYNDFVNKRINIPVKAETKEAKKVLTQLKAMYIDRLASSYALAEMDKYQVTNKIKEVEKELNELNKIHNLNEVTTDELITEYVHNTDTTESFTNRKKEKFAASNKEYKDLLEFKNRLEEKLKKVNIEISEGFFNSKKIQDDFNSLNDIKNNEFEQQEQTEDEKLETTIQTSEVAEVEKELQNKINESIDEEGNPGLTQEEMIEFINSQNIPEEVKDAVVLLNEEQLNTLPTEEVVEEKRELVIASLNGSNENDLKEAEHSSDLLNEDKQIQDYLKEDIIENDGISNLEGKGHLLMSLTKSFKPIFDILKQFVNYEKTPRDKKEDNVSFEIGDFLNGTDNTVKEIWNKLKNGDKINKDQVILLEKYLPIKVVLSNGKQSGFTFLQTFKNQNADYQEIFNRESLPLRRAIVKALIENKGDFTAFNGRVQGQGKGKLNLSENTNNNVNKLSVFDGMTKDQKISYIQENSYYVSNDKQLKSLKTGEVTFEDFKNTIKTLNSGDVFLVVTRPNGEKVPIKLNNKRIEEHKARSTVKLLAYLSKIKKGEIENITVSKEDFKNVLTQDLNEEDIFNFSREIELLNNEKSELTTKIEELLNYVINLQNNNSITKMFIKNNGDLVLGSLIQKVNEDLKEEDSITYNSNLSEIGFTGFNNNNISSLLEDDLTENEQIRFNHLVKFIQYKKTNIQAKFNNKDYINYVFDLDNDSNESGNALVSTNVIVNKDMFEGFSNIFLSNSLEFKETQENKKSKKNVENEVIPTVQDKTYKPPTQSNEVTLEDILALDKPQQSDVEAKKAELEKELFSETDSKGRTFTYFSTTTKKDGLIKIKFSFNRSDKDSSQRANAVMGIPVEKALGDKYTIDEKSVPEGTKVVNVVEIRVSKTGAGATVMLESEGERWQGEVKLNSNTTYDAELEALESENNSENIRNSEKNSVSLQDNTSEVINKGLINKELTEDQKEEFNDKVIDIIGKEAIDAIKDAKTTNDIFNILKNKMTEKGFNYNETLDKICNR